MAIIIHQHITISSFISLNKMSSVRVTSLLSTLILFIASGAWAEDAPRTVTPGNCLVWGPGLISDFVVPARYFYIQAVNQYGENFTDSVGSTAFTLSVTRADGSRFYAVRDVIDRRDGSYIGRYRLKASSRDPIVIKVLYKDQHVAGSPYTLKGPVYDEGCDCPHPDPRAWFSTLQCSPSYSQLEKDFSIFTSPVDFSKVAHEAVKRFTGSISHYKIIDNKIYRRDHFGTSSITLGLYMDEFLLSLSRKVTLPDVEFIMNLSDWPKVKKGDNLLPIASWCGSDENRDIVLPTYELIKSTIYMLERHNTDPFSVQGRTGPPWGEKTSQAFWRGRDSHRSRLDLAVMSQKYPDVINASLTRVAFFPKDEKYGPLSRHMPFFDFFQHKYQINIDGTVAAFRLPFLLASDSAVLKQDSKYYEHFYTDLEPYVHYIPVTHDLSDLLDQIHWAKEHDKEVEAIGRRSQGFVLAHLTPGEIYCYYATFLSKFSKLLKNKPVLEKDFVLVKSKDYSDSSSCDCQIKPQIEKRLYHTEL